MMKVLHISLQDTVYGKGSTARLLHEAEAAYGVQSSLMVKYNGVGQNDYHLFRANNLQEILNSDTYKKADIIYLHAIQGYFRTFDVQLFKDKPVIWSVEDSTVFTAECAEAEHCENWKQHCADCPVAKNEEEKKARTAYVAAKIKTFSEMNLTFICENEYQKKQLEESGFIVNKTEVFSMPIAENAFFPGNKQQARINLGLPVTNLIVIYHNEAGTDSEKKAQYLKTVLGKFRDDINQVFVVNIGKAIKLEAAPGFEVRNVPEISAALLGEYYRAANLNIMLSGAESTFPLVREAAFCALPTLTFESSASKAYIENSRNGILVKAYTEEEAYQHIGRAIIQPQILLNIGTEAYKYHKARYSSNKKVVADQIGLYTQILGGQATEFVDDMIYQIGDYKKYITADVDKALKNGWSGAMDYLQEKFQQDFIARSVAEKGAYLDAFAKACLVYTDWKNDKTALWRLLVLWRDLRDLDNIHFENEQQKQIHIEWLIAVRMALVEYFKNVSIQDFANATNNEVGKLLTVWRAIFLNVQSTLHLEAEEFKCPDEYLALENPSGYPFILIKMMYVPYLDDHAKVNIEGMMNANIPILMKLLTLFWITSAPLYNGNETNRENILNNVRLISDYLVKRNAKNELVANKAFASHFMVSLWRASYLGGNNRMAIEAYARFLQYVAGTIVPDYTKILPLRKRKKEEPLRIGYVSMNFRAQAVSQYMASRLEYADHQKFFVKTFVLRRFNDDMTDKIREYSDETVDFTNFDDIGGMAKTIYESNLDVLIYADIGMEVYTYLLASLRLAPVQAVLVGHGTTTGLSTIDYYISGDHEPVNADEHYTENLVRLPVLGSAQMPPRQTERKMTRADIGVPENAVLFISCANGLKHYPERDELLIEILRKAPDCYILLKPFMGPQSVDKKFANRIVTKAKEAGVDNRLKIMGPLPSPGDLMSLLVLADIQLDTYPYGGWTTNLEAIYYGLPIVTQEGNIARNRWGAGMLRALSIKEGIAKNEKEYVYWAEKLAKDHSLRKKIAEQIRENAEKILFNGKVAQNSYEKVLERIANKEKIIGSIL